MSLPIQSSNFDHIHPGAIGASPRKTDSPSPPPPPPHRNVTSPSKVQANPEVWPQHPSQQLTPPKPFADNLTSDDGSSVSGENEDFGFVAATLPHLANTLPNNALGSPTSSSTSSSQTPLF